MFSPSGLFIVNEHLNIMNMDLHKRLEILQREYDNMRSYYLETAAIGSILIYENADFEREGMLIRKITKNKELLAGKTKTKKNA